MADVELVIKIPEEIYKASQIIDVKYEDVIQIPLEVITNGTPLPNGHGDLIDRKELNSIQSKYKKAIEDIKAELKSKVFSEDWVDNVVYLDDCLEIIDKHTSESEK